MNRFVSLLPAALALAAVSLAQPAQAQWTMGKPYYPKDANGNSLYSQSYTTGTTVTSSSVGHVNVTSSPPATYGTFITSGSGGGSVSVDYTWTGTNTQGVSFATTESLQATGAGNGSGDSNAGGQLAYGDFTHYPGGWTSKATPTPKTYYFGPGVTPKTTETVSFGAHTSVYYNSPAQSPTIVTADVTFGFTTN